MNLTQKQETVLLEVFDTGTASELTLELMDIFEGYLLSSNDYLGEISQDQIKKKFSIIHQISKLISAVEPENNN